MIKIAVVDDEKNIRKEIVELIRKKEPSCQADSYGSGEELLRMDLQYDIVFLDIQLEGKTE